ncbi:MAG: hypothetical protein CFH25_00356 [Alphaproteobacteria bacterium MarineAlpha6_Bin3]|nr:MAG: hypothetical protein CFH25_00356 [Alphaproteobacteria bacterium MarineAlpha6_Bin3]|tara:strand:+ start:22767 stop:23324 length:558 start_codon:yes stop_codon:yes gene_type:complete
MLRILKMNFFFIVFISFIFTNKTAYSATPQVVMECPGLKSFNNWCAGTYKENESNSCIMISAPISEKGDPPYKSRGQAVATIYHMPSEGNNGVVYITTGYNYKKDTIVTLKIDKNQDHEFNVLEGDSAFSDDENVDKKIIFEMKKGNKMKVIGFSSRGTKTTDIYSLVGFSAAYTYISNLCNVKN